MRADLILSNVHKHIELTHGEEEHFLSLLRRKALKKKDFLLKAGEYCKTISYVNSGVLRAFYRDEDDKESTIMFAVSDWWITDMPCFVSQERSRLYIEATTRSDVWELSRGDLESLYKQVPKFERFFRILMQNAYIREQVRILQNLSLSAETRYWNFAEKYPAIVKQVTQKNIASYLGITPEFLSAIRGKSKKR